MLSRTYVARLVLVAGLTVSAATGCAADGEIDQPPPTPHQAPAGDPDENEPDEDERDEREPDENEPDEREHDDEPDEDERDEDERDEDERDES